jgi:uncharacterized repeat protein (TIGR01451 family)
VAGFGNLCPSLNLKNIDVPGETDTPALSTLNNPGDIQDAWQVSLSVPGIAGQIAQDHSGGIVVTSGDYACKITVTTALDAGGCESLDCAGGNNADLVLEKLVDKATTTVNSTVIYSLAINNKGPDTAIGVVMTDVLPATLTFVSASSTQGTYDSLTNTWNVGNLANGAGASINIITTVVGGPTIVNSASVDSISVDPDLSNNNAAATTSVLDGNNPCVTNCGGGPVGCITNCGGGGGGGGGTLGLISGNVFSDSNSNGLKDSGESLLSGWTVYLDSNDNGIMDPGEIFAITDASGSYSFNNLALGVYNVREIVQNNWQQTAPNNAALNKYSVALTSLQSQSQNNNFGNYSFGGQVAGAYTNTPSFSAAEPQVLGASTSLPRTGLPVTQLFYLLAASIVAVFAVGKKELGSFNFYFRYSHKPG